MRIIPVTALAAVLALGLAACAPAAPAATEAAPEAPAAVELPEADLSMFGDVIEDLPEEEMAALRALSERLDPLVPNVYQVDVVVSIFFPGEVTVRLATVDDQWLPTPDEIRALLAELDAFTGYEVTLWTIEGMSVDGFWVKLGPVAIEAGVAEQFIDSYGDIEMTPADIAAYLA